MLDVAAAVVQRVDLALVDVEAKRAEARRHKRVDQRQADVAQPDHSHSRRFVENGLFERLHEFGRLMQTGPNQVRRWLA